MQFSIAFSLVCLVTTALAKTATGPQLRMVCYYDSSSFIKEGIAQLIVDDLEPALQFCDYLIYGYAAIERNSFKALSTNQNLHSDLATALYRTVTRLKPKYPHMKILLSVGGDMDIETDDDGQDFSNKYLDLLESSTGRMNFINTAYDLVKTYDFDGLDIAWQFPKNKPKKARGVLGSLWNSFKKLSSGYTIIDENSEMHKEQFTALIRLLKNKLRPDNFLLSTTVLPNVNSSLFFDVANLVNYVDFVNLAVFDWYTPQRNPDLADLTAPLFPVAERNPEFNADYQVQYWLRHGCPSTKINLGISTYGRPWKMITDSGETGLPPVSSVENDTPLGPNTQTLGLYSWQETCMLLPNADNKKESSVDAPLRKVSDTQNKNGIYAFRAANKEGNNGIWIAYEDPDTAAEKAGYAKNKNLGGVALYDISYDDFLGLCVGDKFPILRAIRKRLVN